MPHTNNFTVVCVQTNVGYIVDVQSITQSETAEQIQEALQVLQVWNTEWKPWYSMRDCTQNLNLLHWKQSSLGSQISTRSKPGRDEQMREAQTH